MIFAKRLRQLRGRRKPSFEAVVKIARALGVSCEAFLDGDATELKPPAKRKKGRK